MNSEMKKRTKRGQYSGTKAKERKERQYRRQKHIQAIERGEISEELPEIIVPELFKDIQKIYWECLKSIPDPRDPCRRVYPLHLILHRIISGFIDGNKHIGVLFPTKRMKVEKGKTKLGGLPTRNVVYDLLRRIDWSEANKSLSPLWERLGHTPDLIVHRNFRNPRVILDEFRNDQAATALEKRKQIALEQKIKERSKGMSAAKAKRLKVERKKESDITKKPVVSDQQNVDQPVVIQHDLVIDGKVVKASYNNGVKERFVHVTEIRQDENDNRSRFIIGAYPTELDRNGEWGAAVSILDALIPIPGGMAIIVSGDAGFSVEEFCNWLNEKGFFLPLPDKGKRR